MASMLQDDLLGVPSVSNIAFDDLLVAYEVLLQLLLDQSIGLRVRNQDFGFQFSWFQIYFGILEVDIVLE